MKGLILAGGKGSRLRPITPALPKQLVPVGNTPVIDYIVEDLRDAGVTDICVVVGTVGSEQIKNHLGDGTGYGVDISYVTQSEPKGPANAVQAAEKFVGDDPFIVYFGDTYIETGITKRLVDRFDPDVHSLALPIQEVDNPSRYGVVDFDSNSDLSRVYEKPDDPPTDLAYMGVIGFTPRVYSVINEQEISSTGELEITETIDELVVAEDAGVSWTTEEGLWKDVGTPADALEMNEILLDQLTPESGGEVADAVDIHGQVAIAEGASIEEGATVTGPVSIGSHATIRSGADIGPYTSVGPSTLVAASVESSILMEGSEVTGDIQLTRSLVGPESVITGGAGIPPTELVVGEGTTIRLG